MISKVKTALRINHNALDSEIEDLIEAARHDLKLSGVSSSKVGQDDDPLIKRGIIVYVKANFGFDSKESERFQKSYDLLKMHLSLSGDYSE